MSRGCSCGVLKRLKPATEPGSALDKAFAVISAFYYTALAAGLVKKGEPCRVET